MKCVASIHTTFFFQKNVILRHRVKLKIFIAQTLALTGHRKSGEVRIIFLSDEELLQINQQYLQHDYYTDIITFPHVMANNGKIDAELYISVDRVKENASENGVSRENELLRVIFHGILHLCGYDDETDRQKQIMREKENELLKKFHVELNS